jgi:hypothetical protein
LIGSFKQVAGCVLVGAALLRQIADRTKDGCGASDHHDGGAPRASIKLLSIEVTVHGEIIPPESVGSQAQGLRCDDRRRRDFSSSTRGLSSTSWVDRRTRENKRAGIETKPADELP